MSEFKSFREIKQYKNGLFVKITEKIHGSNAQILIDNKTVLAGSRTRWLLPGKETDNYGFAAWVSANSSELIEKLGDGRHYGEWYGAGINSGYGLKEKRFVLFNTKDFPPGRPLPAGVDVVPLLYAGQFLPEQVKLCMDKLQTEGSVLVPGFMKPEGIVIEFPAFGHCLKQVFTPEETGWCPAPHQGVNKLAALVDREEVCKRLQPVRLEKLLSRDSTYMDLYPESLPSIAKDYIADLEKEGQLEGADEATIKAIKKALWPWIKEVCERV